MVVVMEAEAEVAAVVMWRKQTKFPNSKEKSPHNQAGSPQSFV